MEWKESMSLLSDHIIDEEREKRFPVLFDSGLTHPPRDCFPFISSACIIIPLSSSPHPSCAMRDATRSFVSGSNLRRLINSSGRQMTASAPPLLNQSGRGARRSLRSLMSRRRMRDRTGGHGGERGSRDAVGAFPSSPVSRLRLSRLSDKSCAGFLSNDG